MRTKTKKSDRKNATEQKSTEPGRWEGGQVRGCSRCWLLGQKHGQKHGQKRSKREVVRNAVSSKCNILFFKHIIFPNYLLRTTSRLAMLLCVPGRKLSGKLGKVQSRKKPPQSEGFSVRCARRFYSSPRKSLLYFS